MNMNKKNELADAFVSMKQKVCYSLEKMLALVGLASLCLPALQASIPVEYEAIYVSRDFRQQPTGEIYSIQVPGVGNCFFWSVLTNVMLHLQGRKNIGPQHALYTSKIGSWRVKYMRDDLAETAWACAVWYGLRLDQNIPLSENESNRVEELVERVFWSNGMANEDDNAKFEYIGELLCRLIDEVRYVKMGQNSEKVDEDLYVQLYGDVPLATRGDNWQLSYDDVCDLKWDDISSLFAMNEYFPLSMLPLMGGVDWICEDGNRRPLSDLGGIRVLSRRLDKHNHFVWGVAGKWNVGARPTVFDVMFSGNHIQPLTACSDIKTGYQEMGEPPFTGRNQLQLEATLETEWQDDEKGEKSLTRARIQELLDLDQRNRITGDPIVVN
ncbi:MAG: hypothetical protein LW808_003515 [Verrucomicrobiota bacterium]|nr:MAG: hypothetical protein LW808_003515 [Verrucomicrobiota bacterium]